MNIREVALQFSQSLIDDVLEQFFYEKLDKFSAEEYQQLKSAIADLTQNKFALLVPPVGEDHGLPVKSMIR
jgi:hypothetical protein